MKLDIATTLLALLPATFAKDILSFDGTTLRKEATSKKIGPLPSLHEDETILSSVNLPESTLPAVVGVATSLCSEEQNDSNQYSVKIGDSHQFYCNEEHVALVMNAATTEMAEYLNSNQMKAGAPWLLIPLVFTFSRKDLKRDIHYLDANSRNQIGQMVLDMPLATWNYKTDAPDTPQRLGFMIDDIEPSFAVEDQIGNSVNTYGFISMAAAAIQMQQEQIKELQVSLKNLGVQVEQA